MDLIRIFVTKDFNIQWIINPWLVIIVLIGILTYMIIHRRGLSKDYEIDEAEMGIGSAKVRIKPNYEDLQIAYKLWVELNTRKIGLTIDAEHDVIEEVYNSWYEFFKITRELIKGIPASKIRRNDSTRKLVNIAIDVLNTGIRPHLTRFQARFRRWYELEYKATSNSGLSPQDIQKKFPDYKSLIEDMRSVNGNLIKYKNKLNDMIMGE
jgi:hypothetical protein